MNREEILAMQPGEALDQLAMKTIFNARKAYYGEESLWYHYGENGEPDYEWSCYNSPSTDISAAWEVVEKNKRWFSLQWNGIDFICEIGIDPPTKVSAKTAPEAICKAALLSLIESEVTT